jgi:hypothetical protein
MKKLIIALALLLPFSAFASVTFSPHSPQPPNVNIHVFSHTFDNAYMYNNLTDPFIDYISGLSFPEGNTVNFSSVGTYYFVVTDPNFPCEGLTRDQCVAFQTENSVIPEQGTIIIQNPNASATGFAPLSGTAPSNPSYTTNTDFNPLVANATGATGNTVLPIVATVVGFILAGLFANYIVRSFKNVKK